MTEAERDRRISQDQLPWHLHHHALFCAYAPIDNPRYACAVVVEHGMGGSRTAAPIARDILLKVQKADPSRRAAAETPALPPRGGPPKCRAIAGPRHVVRSQARDGIRLAVRKYISMLWHMRRAWLRRILTPLLGLVFAASMSVSAVQATEMAVKMTMATAMDVASDHGKCADCDHGNGGVKGMDCRLAVCGAPGVATLAPMLVAAAGIVEHDLPIPALSSLVGWAHPPDPYPPRPCTLG